MKSLIENTNVTNLEDKTGTEDHSCGRGFINLSFVLSTFYARSLEKEMGFNYLYLCILLGHPLHLLSGQKVVLILLRPVCFCWHVWMKRDELMIHFSWKGRSSRFCLWCVSYKTSACFGCWKF